MIIRNECRNPSAETGLAGWSAAGGTLSHYGRASGWPDYLPGAWMLAATASGSLSSLFIRTDTAPDERYPVSPGQWVGARAWIAHESGIAAGAALQLVFYDAAGVSIATESTSYTQTPIFDGGWRTLVRQAPAQTATYIVAVRGYSGSAAFIPAGLRLWVDSVTQVHAASLAEADATLAAGYFDGDSPGWVWEGVPHASASRGPAGLYRSEASLWQNGTRLAYVDLVDGFSESATSGSSVQVAPFGPSGSRTTVNVRPSDAGTGTATLHFVRELGDGTPGQRSAALYAALRTGGPLELRFTDTEPGLSGFQLVPTGRISRTRHRSRTGVWTVEFDFDRLDAP